MDGLGELELMVSGLRTKVEHRYLESWLRNASLEYHGRGCESEISVGYLDGLALKVKTFRRYSEFRRHVIGAFVLSSVLLDHNWLRYVRIPAIWGVDLHLQIIISPFVHRVCPGLDDDEVWANRVKAVTALVCAAGQFADFDSAEIRKRARAAEELGVSSIGDAWLGGVDLNGDNLIYDGTIWWAVDF